MQRFALLFILAVETRQVCFWLRGEIGKHVHPTRYKALCLATARKCAVRNDQDIPSGDKGTAIRVD